MRNHIKLAAAASLLALGLGAGALAFDGHSEQVAEAAAAKQVQTYTAEQFFNSTSFGLGSSGGFVFSSDGQFVLINSDSSGVFNAYMLPVNGGEPIALTQSTTNAIFARSFSRTITA